MARRGALTALQAALAGVSGGAQGYIQQRELERKREQEKADRERQQAIDVMGLQERGYTTAEQYAKQRQSATARGGQVASQALLSALNPMAGAPPVAQVTGEGVSALSQALAMPEEPRQRVSMYGQEFVRAESPMQREDRLAREERARSELEKKTDRRERAEQLAEANAIRLLISQQSREMTDYQRAQLGIAQQELRLKQQEAAQNKSQPAPAAATGTRAFSREDVDFLRQFAPVSEQQGDRTVYRDPENALSTLDIQFARNNVTNWAAGANEQRYAAIAGSIADAKARASEKGVLTNQDIDRYRNAIMIRVGDNIATKADKFRRMLQWADEFLGTGTASGMPNNPEAY